MARLHALLLLCVAVFLTAADGLRMTAKPAVRASLEMVAPSFSRQSKPATQLNAATIASPASSSAIFIRKASVGAVSKLLATCGIGAFAAQKKVLTQQALSTLSSLVFNLFQPCLLFVNVCQTIAAQRAQGGSPIAYILPLAAGIQIALGFIIGKVVGKVLYGENQESSEAKQFLTCSTFGNSGPLPLVFTDALFRMSSNSALLSNAVAYISLYLLGWSPLFWVVGTTILSNPADDKTKEEKRQVMIKRIFSPPVLGSIAGMLIGTNAFLSDLFILKSGVFHSIFEGMRTIGAGYLPCVLMILAGSLIAPPPKDLNEEATTIEGLTKYQELKKGFGIGHQVGTGRAFMKQIIATYLTRFLLLPALAFTGLKALAAFAPTFHAYLISEPLLLFILLLEFSMPPAQNSVTIMQLSGDKKGAGMMARSLLVIYSLGIPALTFWLVRILSFTRIAL